MAENDAERKAGLISEAAALAALTPEKSIEYEAEGEFKLQAEDATGRALKTAPDGKTVLIPQPSDDPNDPLNWSWKKKHMVLLSLLVGSLLTDAGVAWGSTLFEAQAADWKMSVPAVANSISGSIFMQGPGGILYVPLNERFGRLPVLFWSQFLSAMMNIGASLAPTYGGFTACRVLYGFFDTAPQVIGLSVIHDMFFFHERARKINLWAFAFLVGPWIGPFLSAFLLKGVSWRADFGVLAGLYGFSTVVIALIGDETLYNRRIPTKPSPGIGGRISLLLGITGARAVGRLSMLKVLGRILTLNLRPHVFLTSTVFVLVLFTWLIGLNTTMSQFVRPPPYLFDDTGVALMFLAPTIGVIIGQFWGHWFVDFIADRHIKRHGGKTYLPENRLWGAYLPVFFGIVGLVTFGETLEHKKHWIGLAFGFGLYAMAGLAGTTAISAYLLDSFPRQGPMVAAMMGSIINMWRTTGGFCVVYFQIKWVAHNGAAVSFGCQAAILAAAFLAVVAVQIWGKKWRLKYPLPSDEL